MDKTTKYDDIINLPHPTSKRHPRMSMIDRAAQFSAFAALTGYDAAIKETARTTDTQIELSEDECEQLNEKLQFVQAKLNEHYLFSFIYFVPDINKSGGAYKSQEGIVKKIDLYKECIVLTDDTVIALKHLIDIHGDAFKQDEFGR